MLPARRRAGVCLHVTSLPGAHGIGEIGAAAHRFVDTLADIGLGVWQFLPLGPTAYADSPYQSLSTFAGNEMLIDVAELVEGGLLRMDELHALESLPRHTVDYGALIPAKQRLLDLAARRFAAHADAEAKAGFERFVARHDAAWLHDYALFRILKTRHGERPWMDWEPAYMHREPQALARTQQQNAADIEGIKVLQYLFDRQWRRLHEHAKSRGITLFGDMPYLHRVRFRRCLDEPRHPPS